VCGLALPGISSLPPSSVAMRLGPALAGRTLYVSALQGVSLLFTALGARAFR